MHIVFGANGRAGGETARALLALGAPVRVVLREPEQAAPWSRLGAEIAITSIEDAQGMVSALSDASGAFLLSPAASSGNPYQRGDDVGLALASAVRRARVPKIVALSSVGAQHEVGTGIVSTLHSLERHLAGAVPSTTFLRPAYFLETWEEVAQPAILDGVLPSFLAPERRIPMVSTVDVGRLAATLLLEDFVGQRIVQLAGPKECSANDVAASFSQVLGRPVNVDFVPVEARALALSEAGVSPQVAQALIEMYDGIESGLVAFDARLEHRRGSMSLIDAVSRIVSKHR